MKPDPQDLQGRRAFLRGRAKWSAAIGVAAVVTTVVLVTLRLLPGPATRDEGEEGAPGPTLAAGELIAFVREGPLFPVGDSSVQNDPDIFTLGADGRARNLTKNPAGLESTPAWSPDGTKIVFARAVLQSSASPQYELYIARSDGSKLRPLTHCGGGYCHDWSPQWSPDGRVIAFHSSRDGAPTGIYLIGPRGGRARLIKRTNSFGGLSWSPDGETIVYSTPGRWFGLFLMASDGSNPRPLIECPPRSCTLGYWAPAWSPDGSWIAFVGLKEGDLYLIRPDGTGLRKLLDCPEACHQGGGYGSPAWSPDGTRIAVEEARNTLGSLVLVRVSDGAHSTLTRSQRIDCCPAFRPTGSR